MKYVGLALAALADRGGARSEEELQAQGAAQEKNGISNEHIFLKNKKQ